MDFAQARSLMVETQVRTSDVTDPKILAALRALPRENFVPSVLKSVAYADQELEVAPGRHLMRPRDMSKLLQALSVSPGEKVLEIAGATGYGAAALALLGAQVVAVDPDPSLSAAARTALEASHLPDVVTCTTDIARGWPDAGPYDVIVLHGGAEFVPEPWFAQLDEGGRLGVVIRDGAAGQARIYTKSNNAIAYRTAFDAAPPIAPGLRKPVWFAF
jgi:protein-L-isoaspartate(D-aspartate) O-methyltransferase